MAGSYVSQLVSGKLTPAEFVAKCADWIKNTPMIARYADWFIEAVEKFLVAKGIPAFVAEVITNELKEAVGIKPPSG